MRACASPSCARACASAASVAGLLAVHSAGELEPGQVVVCTLTGHGLKDTQWAVDESTAPQVIPVDAAAIAARADAGDVRCVATLERYEARLARALAGVINLLDPDVIVLGGGLSRIERLYANVPRLWGAHVFSEQVETRLLPARHGDASGVRGAAWLWPAG